MKKKDVKLGGVYLAGVSRKMALVRIDRVNPFGGWEGTNLLTGRLVRIRGPQRLRKEASQRDFELFRVSK